MQTVFDFFVDPLIWPIYIYLAAYGFVWLLAFGLSRLFANKLGIESGVARAWRIAITGHILGGLGLVIWLWLKAVPLVPAWWYIPLYLIPYLTIIFLVDVFSLLAIQGRTRTRMPRRSGNPRRR